MRHRSRGHESRVAHHSPETVGPAPLPEAGRVIHIVCPVSPVILNRLSRSVSSPPSFGVTHLIANLDLPRWAKGAVLTLTLARVACSRFGIWRQGIRSELRPDCPGPPNAETRQCLPRQVGVRSRRHSRLWTTHAVVVARRVDPMLTTVVQVVEYPCTTLPSNVTAATKFPVTALWFSETPPTMSIHVPDPFPTKLFPGDLNVTHGVAGHECAGRRQTVPTFNIATRWPCDERRCCGSTLVDGVSSGH